MLRNYLIFLLAKRSKEEGFTLIELLVVVAIIGILATIAVFSAIPAINGSRVATAQSNVGSISRQQLAYRVETGDFTNDITLLESGVTPQTNDYEYGVSVAGFGSDRYALATATPQPSQPDLPGVAAKVTQRSEIIICVGSGPGIVPDMATVIDETECP